MMFKYVWWMPRDSTSNNKTSSTADSCKDWDGNSKCEKCWQDSQTCSNCCANDCAKTAPDLCAFLGVFSERRIRRAPLSKRWADFTMFAYDIRMDSRSVFLMPVWVAIAMARSAQQLASDLLLDVFLNQVHFLFDQLQKFYGAPPSQYKRHVLPASLTV